MAKLRVRKRTKLAATLGPTLGRRRDSCVASRLLIEEVPIKGRVVRIMSALDVNYTMISGLRDELANGKTQEHQVFAMRLGLELVNW